ncbi:EndoU domain-containing protein, partial [Proteus sp. G2660]
ENTTQSAVSQGTWTVRDSDNQQQDIAQLSQDTDNAHSTLNKIFDKEKEQSRQQKQQLVGEIGAQIIDLATTADTIRGTHQAKEESRLDNFSDTAYDDIYQALSETHENVTERDVQNYLFQQRLQDYTNQSEFGTGGKYTRAIQAITAFTQGMMGNNIVTAIANGSAPYLAKEVKNQVQGNSVESDIQRALAHGLLNAGLALAKGENVAAQATGAMTGETVGILSHSLYGKAPEELTESEKQNISAWATLASGIAGGLISDNSAGVANAAQAGKVVVENNVFGPKDLPAGMAEYGQAMSSLAISMARNDNSIEEINTALTRAAKGIHPEEQDPALGIMIAWGNITGIPLDVFLIQQKMTPEKAAEIVGSTPPTTTAKALQFIAAKTYLAFVKNGQSIPKWEGGEYLYDFKPSSTPLELVQEQGGNGLKTAYIRMDHILKGEVKIYKNGFQKAGGGHYLRDPNVRVDKWTAIPDINGVSKGYISVRNEVTGKWIKKQSETTFFPEHWSKRQTAQEIESAFKNSTNIPNTEKWTGYSDSGVKIEGYYGKPDGSGATAWPVFEGRSTNAK